MYETFKKIKMKNDGRHHGNDIRTYPHIKTVWQRKFDADFLLT